MGCSGTRAEDFLVDRVKKCRKKLPEAQERSLVGGLTTQLGEKDVEGLDVRAEGELGKVNNREATPKSQQEAVLRPQETSEPLTDGVKFQEPATALLSNHGSEVQLKGHSQQYTNTGFSHHCHHTQALHLPGALPAFGPSFPRSTHTFPHLHSLYVFLSSAPTVKW